MRYRKSLFNRFTLTLAVGAVLALNAPTPAKAQIAGSFVVSALPLTNAATYVTNYTLPTGTNQTIGAFQVYSGQNVGIELTVAGNGAANATFVRSSDAITWHPWFTLPVTGTGVMTSVGTNANIGSFQYFTMSQFTNYVASQTNYLKIAIKPGF